MAIVLGAGILPLAITGWLLTQSVRRIGTEVLGARLDSTLIRVADDVGNQWVQQRSMLLTIADSKDLSEMLGEEHGASTVVPLPELSSVHSEVRRRVRSVTVHASSGRIQFSLVTRDSVPVLAPTETAPAPPVGSLLQSVDVVNRTGAVIGVVEAAIDLDLAESAVLDPTAGVGAILGMSNPKTGEALQPLPFDPAMLDSTSFMWGGEHWVLSRRALGEPQITLLAAAPIDPYLAPANRLASWALVALAVVGTLVTLVSLWMAARLTRSLVALADGADAVAQGNLGHRMQVTGEDEVARVGTAFNQMTTNLERTLALLAQRQAIAEVGEFASVLAHEIRNPLSAIRLSL
ncbi:MAG TPA: HAMP domain-containing protein, partial [Gemmatimonas sp.]|nr:HAMP domain-containing protein [Gemmatimonas sp.]